MIPSRDDSLDILLMIKNVIQLDKQYITILGNHCIKYIKFRSY